MLFIPASPYCLLFLSLPSFFTIHPPPPTPFLCSSVDPDHPTFFLLLFTSCLSVVT
nr:MAG TPA: hypothetical protein [Caudoviricetes sp.]